MKAAFRALEALLEERRGLADPQRLARYDGDHDRARRILTAAVPYYWAEEQCRLLDTIAPTLPGHWKPIRQACESEAGFFYFAIPPVLLPPTALAGHHIAPVLTWRQTEMGLEIMVYALNRTRRTEAPQVTFFWPWDCSLDWAHATMAGAHQRMEEQHQTIIDRDFLAMNLRALQILAVAFAFLEQRILVIRQERAPRAMRRRLPTGTPDDIVHIVTLRRQIRTPESPAGTHPEHAVAWSCRWIVRGHWRDQWFPTLETHRPIWILPYGKGPEEKPLKMPGTKLFAVVR